MEMSAGFGFVGGSWGSSLVVEKRDQGEEGRCE
jgi:hypothetical protein